MRTRSVPRDTFEAVPAAPPAGGADAIWDVLSLAGVATCIVGDDSKVVWCNPALADLIAREPAEIIGRSLNESIGSGPQDSLDKVLRRVAGSGELMQRHEVEAIDGCGDRRTLALSGAVTTAWRNKSHLVIVAEDLTPGLRSSGPARPAVIEANRLTNQDALTGLANRDKLDSLLTSSLERARRTGSPFAVLLCDLDGFDSINDEIGHPAGDEVLQWVATRLTHTLRHHDALARLGGDEFVVIAETVPDEKTANLVAHRLIAAISDPISAGGRDLRVGMTVGLTMANGRERPQDLLANADRAMHAAKRSHRGGVMSLSQVLDSQAHDGTDPNDLNGLTEFTGMPEIRRGRHFKAPHRLIETNAVESAGHHGEAAIQ